MAKRNRVHRVSRSRISCGEMFCNRDGRFVMEEGGGRQFSAAGDEDSELKAVGAEPSWGSRSRSEG